MDDLENVHTRFCKIITKNSKYCHNSFIYGELGQFPLQITATIRVLNNWKKVINGEKDKICFLIYNMVKHLNCIGKYTSPWLGYVKGTLENCGLNSVWMSHVQSGSGVSSECVKRILQDQFLQKWFSRISEDETLSVCMTNYDSNQINHCILLTHITFICVYCIYVNFYNYHNNVDVYIC